MYWKGIDSVDVFHSGERSIQRRVGVQRIADQVGQMIQPYVTEDFQWFLESQPWLVMGSTDSEGRLWVSALCGEPGIIRLSDDRTVHILRLKNTWDLVYTNVLHNTNVGLIVINFGQRIRIRINGMVKGLNDQELIVKTDQVYGNCPKYIQARGLKAARLDPTVTPEVVHDISLDERQQAWIRQADTFFIASANAEGKTDVSHRGGRPGFIRVLDERTLVWPDYTGNMMFNTLGNIVENPKSGLLFLDFDDGHTLQLTGYCTIVWSLSVNDQASFPGVQRLIQFRLSEVIHIRHAHNCSWDFIGYSPYNP